MIQPFPAHRLDLAYYGDDFTGSTDVLEVLTQAGIPTVLLLRQPSDDVLRRFPEIRAIGIAGTSRSKSPAWMQRELPGIFAELRKLGAPLVHYKVCSTFDSSPEIGSIGCAIDIGQQIFHSICTPMIVGAPALHRYTAFGNLFATVDGVTYRLDRHPTMSLHPVTPMKEADLRRHLGQQTRKKIALIDLLALKDGRGAESWVRASEAGAEIILIDVLDEASQLVAGELVATTAEPAQFVAGSSGIEYALVAYWQSIGRLGAPMDLRHFKSVDRLLVVSGSCSPVTARQIATAKAAGFVALPLDLAYLLSQETQVAEELIWTTVAPELAAGRSVIVYSADGPGDPLIDQTRRLLGGADQINAAIGSLLGGIAKRVRLVFQLPRIVVAGGDTSGAVAGVLDLSAVTMIAATVPGSPLCRAISDRPEMDGLEVVFKGGQVGGKDYFIKLRDGAG